MSKFDPTDENPVLLKKLLHEMQVCLAAATKKETHAVDVRTLPNDVVLLQDNIRGLADRIYSSVNDAYIKAVANSVLDTWSVEDAYADFEAFNKGQSPFITLAEVDND